MGFASDTSRSVAGFDVEFGNAPGTITVLHVDDDGDLAALVATFLQRANPAIEVVTETDADAALERLASDERDVDCIVSDFQMPDTDGIELLKLVRDRFADLPFILYTGQGSEEVAGQAISAGVTDYLQKESGTEQYTVLANRIENVVDRDRSERKIAQLLEAIESAREGISLLDEDGHFVYANQSYADAFGYDEGALLGEHWKTLFSSGEYARLAEDVLPKVGRAGWEGGTTMVRADGTELDVDHAISHTPEGLFVSTVDVVATDGGSRESLHANALDALDDLLFFFDADGTLRYWNDRVEAVTGYDPTELSSLTPAEFVPEADRPLVERYVEETRRNGEARVEARIQRANGETVPYEFISRRVRDEGDAVVGDVGLARDISTRKAFEERLEVQNERLEYFAEVLSHDLRNPLNVAIGRIELFNETHDETHYRTARKALARMESLVSDVLALAQTGEAISLTEYERADLGAVAEDAWSLLLTDDASLEVVDSTAIRADYSRLQQVLENLLRNTIEHGGPGVSVRIGLLSGEEGFYLADDGPGIPESDRENVFEAGRSTKVDGTGFGLAAVHQLVDAHGWTVRIVESDAGGTRFEVSGVEYAD